MNTYEFLKTANEFRSIIWFLVFVAVLAVVIFSARAFEKQVDKKECNGLLVPDNRLNDDWD